MTMLDGWAARVLADPLAEARAASAAIGYVGFDLPEDLLAASGRFAAHLPWDADAPTPAADQWLEGSFAPWARSILEQWAEGAFDFLESVIFSRGDDSVQRLYYYITELQRRGRVGGPRPLILDIARIDRASSLARTEAALRRLTAELGVNAAGLREGAAIANQRRDRLAQLDAARSGPGSRYERLARASLFAPLPETSGAVPDARSAPRLLLAGTPPPDDRLHLAVEAVGWNIVGEAHERALGRLGAPLDPGHDPFAAVAKRVHAVRFGPRSFADPAAELVAEARRVGAEAVLLWLIEQEESIVWHVPAQRRALAEAGLPALVLTRRAWDASDGAADEIMAWLAEDVR